MSSRHLHIISFDIPWPADYGGVIDVFYQIKALSEAGVKIHLHCFVYGGRKPEAELEKYCETVSYYKRRTGIVSLLSPLPYIIKSRMSDELTNNLLKDDYPIVCQGFHSCGIVTDKRFENRRVILRAANVEHEYYAGLAKDERNPLKKLYYFLESRKLHKYSRLQEKAKTVIAISDTDAAYFRKTFPALKVVRIYGFNALDKVETIQGNGTYALFHGNLSVRENSDAAMFLIKKVAPLTDFKIIIAGKNPTEDIIRAAKTQNNTEIIANPQSETMGDLIRNAHIQLMLTFRPAGFKLKLIVSLFRGRFVVANDGILTGTTLADCVVKANTAEEIAAAINNLARKEFTAKDTEHRNRCLSDDYHNKSKAMKMIEVVF